MATTLWKMVRGGSPGARVFSAYLALVLAVALLGPGIAVYASESEEAPVVDPVAESAVLPVAEEVPSTVVPEAEVPVVEPVAEAPAPAPAEPAAEPSVEPAVTVMAPAAPVVAASTPVLSGDANPPLTAGGIRIDSPSSGTYVKTDLSAGDIKEPVPADFSITLTTWEDSSGWWVSFTSNYPIAKVVVKGGSGGANLYNYSPAVYSDTALHAPANPNEKWAGLSHLDFYFGTIDEPETGDLVVYKFQDDNRNGEHDSGEAMLEDWHFTVTRESAPIELASASAIEPVGEGDTDSDGELAFTGLAPGWVCVAETLTSGWENVTPLKQGIMIVAGETAELWFGNVPVIDEPETGDLVIHKFEDTNENKIHDSGEAMLEDWEFTVVNPTGPVGQDLKASLALIGTGTTDENGELTFSSLNPGTVRITETQQEGWDNTTPLTQDAVIVAGETAHVWFGNVPVLPFTELDLSITKVADDHSVVEGQLITYTLTYQNLMSEEDAYNYTIVDDYDERYLTIVNANGGVVAGGKITWTFAGPLSKAMGPQTLTYTARVIADMPEAKTMIDNTVVIDDDRDFNPANNRDDERVVYDPGDPFLPFTGGEAWLLVLAATVTSVVGLLLRLKPRAV